MQTTSCTLVARVALRMFAGQNADLESKATDRHREQRMEAQEQWQLDIQEPCHLGLLSVATVCSQRQTVG